MKKTLPLFSALAVYMTIVVSLCNFYLFFAFLQTNRYEYIELLPWLLLSLGTFGAVRLFLREERSLPQVVTIGSICYVITMVIMNLFFVHVTGVFARLVVSGFLALTTVLGINLQLDEFKQQNLMLCCELPAIGIGILLFMDFGAVFYFPTSYAMISIVILICTVLALTRTRMDGGKTVQDGKKHIAMGTTAMCFAGMAGLAVGFVHFAIGSASQTVSTVSVFLKNLFLTIIRGIEWFVAWLFSLFPMPEGESMELPPPDSGFVGAEEAAMEGMDLGMLPLILAIVLLVALVGVAAFLLYHFRKTKLSGKVKIATYKRPNTVRKRVSFWEKFVEFWKKKWREFVFAIQVLRYRNTPKGALIVLAQIGKKRGVEKASAESYHNYLLRLIPLCNVVDENVEQLLLTLSELANTNLYAPKTSETTLTKKEYQLMRSVVGKIK